MKASDGKILGHIHLANHQALAGSHPDEHSFVGQLRRYAMASLLAFFSFQRLHGFRQVVTHVQPQQKS